MTMRKETITLEVPEDYELGKPRLTRFNMDRIEIHIPLVARPKVTEKHIGKLVEVSGRTYPNDRYIRTLLCIQDGYYWCLNDGCDESASRWPYARPLD